MRDGDAITCEWCHRTFALGQGEGQFGENGEWLCNYCIEAREAQANGTTVGTCARCHGPVIGAASNDNWTVTCKRCIQERLTKGATP